MTGVQTCALPILFGLPAQILEEREIASQFDQIAVRITQVETLDGTLRTLPSYDARKNALASGLEFPLDQGQILIHDQTKILSARSGVGCVRLELARLGVDVDLLAAEEQGMSTVFRMMFHAEEPDIKGQAGLKICRCDDEVVDMPYVHNIPSEFDRF